MHPATRNRIAAHGEIALIDIKASNTFQNHPRDKTVRRSFAIDQACPGFVDFKLFKPVSAPRVASSLGGAIAMRNKALLLGVSRTAAQSSRDFVKESLGAG